MWGNEGVITRLILTYLRTNIGFGTEMTANQASHKREYMSFIVEYTVGVMFYDAVLACSCRRSSSTTV